MPVESDADRAAFLAADEFGVSVLWSGQSVAVAGILDNPYAEGRQFNDAPAIAGSSPSLTVRSLDLPAGAGEGDALTITDQAAVVSTWKVLGPLQPDGTGMTRIMLEKAS